MSSARHHAEWLSLIDVSGPFLALPVLLRVWPQGLEAHDPEVFRSLRSAFGEWAGADLDREVGMHQAFLRFVLKSVLEIPAEAIAEGQAVPSGLSVRVPGQEETLRPDLVVVNPATQEVDPGKPRLLVMQVPWRQDPHKAIPGRRWNASPAVRMMELLRATEVKLGLVTDGNKWVLVHAPRGEAVSYATWLSTLWLEDRITLQAFRALLGRKRFWGVPPADRLEALYAESASDQQEVTDQLGLQVRKAVEVLIQAIDRIDRDLGRALLAGMDEKRLYDAALTVMMRLVFLFAAEENKLLLLGDPIYDSHYAVSTLRSQLREAADQHGEEILQFRHDAWSRLIATFRAVYGGVRHQALRQPAYGGGLFDPDLYPFLEGRAPGTRWGVTPARPLPIDNRTVLLLLEALQILQVKVPGGTEARRLSFRALDVEQIGHVYEGLLDHTAVRATEPVLGLAGAKGREPEVPLSEVEAAQAKGSAEFLKWLGVQTGKTEKGLARALAQSPAFADQRLREACDNDAPLALRIKPFAGLLRLDVTGVPVVIPTGGVYCTQGADRRTTGTHYTPRSLTEPIVGHALDPLVYRGMAEGVEPSPATLETPAEILSLRVCDMACGSGAFLVQACRYLAGKLTEAWRSAEETAGDLITVPEGDPLTGTPAERPLPADPDERMAIAMRAVAERCLYGVDRNPMAVEMAKLSLWLVTLARHRPFTFLDHAIRCGDSLLGLVSPEQIATFHVYPERALLVGGKTSAVFDYERVGAPALERAIARRQELEAFVARDIRDAQTKARLLEEAQAALGEVRLIANMVAGAALETAGQAKKPWGWWRNQEAYQDDPESAAEALDERLFALGVQLASALDPGASPEARAKEQRELADLAMQMLESGRREDQPGRRPFHWVLEFPEVFAAGDPGDRGFDAIVGNPPFSGGQKITGALGTDYRDYLVEHVAAGQRGSADLCAYFFLRAGRLVRPGGLFALLATNTICQGDTREVGLDQLAEQGFAITRAIASRKWPGEANLEVAHVWLRRGNWDAAFTLEDAPVPGITPLLTAQGEVAGRPYRLKANEGLCFQGSIVLGLGFVMTPEEAEALISRDPRNGEVLFPYLTGEDLNSRPDQSPSRWAINFRDWPLDRSAPGSWKLADEKQRKKWRQAGSVPTDYPDPVAADYPDCLAIVREKVLPQRAKDNRALYREKWWRYAERRLALYTSIGKREEVVAISRVSHHIMFAVVSGSFVYADSLYVFPEADRELLAVLQSSVNDAWARQYSSTLETRVRYSPTDCFETFPLPDTDPRLAEVVERYLTLRSDFCICSDRQIGLTKVYNRLHDPGDDGEDIRGLRDRQNDMDRAVADAYGWADLDLGHGFHETKQGLRFTVSERARREILDRLLKLNHERYAAEVAQGLHDKPGKIRKKRQADGGADPGPEGPGPAPQLALWS